MQEWDDMSDIAKIRDLRRAAECLRRSEEDAAWIKPEYREELADRCDAEADRIEAGAQGLKEEVVAGEALLRSPRIAFWFRNEKTVTVSQCRTSPSTSRRRINDVANRLLQVPESGPGLAQLS